MLYNGFIYLAKSDTGHYKIGRSKNPYGRIKHFDTIMPVEVKIVHYFPCDNPAAAESILHRWLAPYRTKGEWFTLSDSTWKRICDILYFLDNKLVSTTSERQVNTCCYEAIQETVRRKYVVEVDGDVYQIHAKCMRHPAGWFGPDDLGDNEPLGKWHSSEIKDF